MKPIYNLRAGKDVYAKLIHTFKNVEFTILVNEEIKTNNDTQECIAIFRTPKGKFRHDFLASKELIDNASEAEFMESMCDMAYNSFEKTHGWT